MCAGALHIGDSADRHVNAAGPQRSVEPAGAHPLCHPDHGGCLGEFRLLPATAAFFLILICDLAFGQAYRGARRRRCYPPSWKRWVFYLLPGAACALIGVCLYIFAGTEDNYYYTHSLWHILVASCVVFLLPPKEKNRETLGWSRGFNWSWRPRVCGYTLCESGKDELCTVT